MRLSIRYQLFIPLVVVLLGMVGMSNWTAWSSANHAWQQIEAQMSHVAETVNNVTFPRNEQTLRLMKGLSGAEYLLCHSNGEPLRDSDDQAMTTLPDLPVRLPRAVERGVPIRLGPRVEVANKKYFCQGVYLGSQEMWILYIFYPESLWQDVLWTAVRPSLFLGLFGGLGSLVLAGALAQRMSQRVQELESRTRQIAGGDFSPMPLPRRDDELRDLGKSVNDMAARLAHLQEAVKHTERLRLLGQVSGGLAHQLRNGVAGARLAVQLHVRELNGQADPESLQVALRQLSLVELQLKRFLDLGRLEELRREPCNLAALLEDTLTLLRPKCRHNNIQLEWQKPEGRDTDFSLAGDCEQLQHVLLNVITNAIEAAGPSGRVHVELRRDAAARRYIVAICDSGPGPGTEIADRLFEPFVTGKREGVGLGLAIARQVLEAHGGSIAWQRLANETCFHIELPVHVGQNSDSDCPERSPAPEHHFGR